MLSKNLCIAAVLVVVIHRCTRTKRKISNSKCICAAQASGTKRSEWLYGYGVGYGSPNGWNSINVYSKSVLPKSSCSSLSPKAVDELTESSICSSVNISLIQVEAAKSINVVPVLADISATLSSRESSVAATDNEDNESEVPQNSILSSIAPLNAFATLIATSSGFEGSKYALPPSAMYCSPGPK
ncbi:hypothetical protein HUJ05_006673 [Dendroctonus ponderosae]|nr:hypothetical protein HUJ05_006673 [Dendroctonus ponderosae]